MIDDILALPRFDEFNPNKCYTPVEIATIFYSQVEMFYIGGVSSELHLLVSEDLHFKNDKVHMHDVKPLRLENIVHYKPLMELKPKEESERYQIMRAYGKPKKCKEVYLYLTALEDQNIVENIQTHEVKNPAVVSEVYSIVKADIKKSYQMSRIFRKLFKRYSDDDITFEIK